MSDGEDKDVIVGDEDYEEKEDGIATAMDASSVASLDDAPVATHATILDSRVLVDARMTTAKRQPSPTSQVSQVGC